MLNVGQILIIGMLYALLGMFGFMFFDMWRRTRKLAKVLQIALGLTLAITLVNTVSFIGTMLAGRTSMATVSEVAQEFGFESGKSYPLVLGNRFAGTMGELHVSSGLFSVSADAKFTPGTATTVSFDYDGKSYMLELPTDYITFVLKDDVEPSIKMSLNHADMQVGGDPVMWKGVNGEQTLVERELSPCQPAIHYLMLLCDQEVLSKKVTLGPIVKQRGLSRVVREYFDRAEITLTPEQYSQLLNG